MRSEGYAMIQRILVTHRTRRSFPLLPLPLRLHSRISNQFSFTLNPSLATKKLSKSYLMESRLDFLKSSMFEIIYTFVH